MAWITGRHAIIAAIERRAAGTLYVVEGDSRSTSIKNTALRARMPVTTVTAAWLRSNAGGSARGVALRLDERARGTVYTLDTFLSETRDSPPPGPIVAIDHVTDPHNLGAILRSAWWFGAGIVLVPARRSAPISDVVHRSSAGAASLVPLAHVSNLRNALERCKDSGWWVYAADAGGEDLTSIDMDPRAVIVLGAEGAGISPIIGRLADATVSIPRYSSPGSVDSLNVSVSAGILLYEYRRRRTL